MSRLGAVKVKTRCITCTIRRVECDGTRPACCRCTSTGWKCDGYIMPPAGGYSSYQRLHVPTQLAPDAELRAVAFYRRDVAPRLAGSIDSYFWTHLVPQISYQEPAAKHASLAISSLYEAFNEDSVRLGERNTFAISQYNKAILHLKTTRSEETVVFVCILFLCIEILRGDWKTAIHHCRHGINILNGIKHKSNFIKDHLEPAFCRVSVFPFFFGSSPKEFPVIDLSCAVPTYPFHSILQAQTTLDWLMLRTIRFKRFWEGYGHGDTAVPEPDAAAMQEKDDIKTSLDTWLTEFRAFRKQRRARKYSLDAKRESVAERLYEVKGLVSQIWIETSFVQEESVYDSHLDKFRSILELAEQAKGILQQTWKNYPRAKFTFEVGFSPPLTLTLIKCRSLNLRVAAMRLMKDMCHEKENMWNRSAVLALAGQLAKFEHGLQTGLDEDPMGVVDDGTLPPEERRVKTSRDERKSALVAGIDGAVTVRKTVAQMIGQQKRPLICVEEERQ
ncbi:C6 zinc finger protein [Colletotrichum zoysiae]|uniref:C6 zinc finger protein n=1 Tax=Colletotrichum zoysiae TaxID=1216348 RepID=A0AAD9HV07_9PEZI|nr:C6 zinc finger protein [Colletotrichum zoysiae]